MVAKIPTLTLVQQWRRLGGSCGDSEGGWDWGMDEVFYLGPPAVRIQGV